MNKHRFAFCLAVVAGLLSANQVFAGIEKCVVIKINAPSGAAIYIRNAVVDPGKFHQEGGKGTSVSEDSISTIVIPAGESDMISSCGVECSAAGTEGSFDIYDGDTKVGHYSWACPGNKSEWDSSSAAYDVQQSGANRTGDDLGTVTLNVKKR
jgi:hypothetical protein